MIERYTRREMGRLFSDRGLFQSWLEVELAVVDAWAELGRVPKEAAQKIRQKAKFSLRCIRQIEQEVGHDVIAFLQCVAENVGEEARYIHLGLTSNDVIDTAQGLRLKQAGELLLKGLDRLIATSRKLALTHKHTLMAGRTHGIQAEPITFGLKALIWYTELRRQRSRLQKAFEEVSVGKISGAVGTYAHLPPELEEKVLHRLGLKRCEITNQIVQRDRHAFLMACLACLGGTLEKIAITVRSLQRSEIGELYEPFGKAQKGSSAMPHKRNPIISERICGLSRVLRGNALAMLESQALWDERDISHSSVERVALVDSLILTDYLLDKTNWLLDGLEVNEKRMKENLDRGKGLIFSQRVLLALIEKGLSREQAYEMVQRNAKKTWEGGAGLMENLDRDLEVRKYLSRKELADLFSYDYFLKHLDYIYQRCGVEEKKGKKSTPARAESEERKGTRRAAKKSDKQSEKGEEKESKAEGGGRPRRTRRSRKKR